MKTDNRPGRHRAPGGYSPLGELKSIARESAQPAMKGAAVVAAAGGLVATLTAPASAETMSGASAAAPVAAPKVAAPKAAAAVGPDAALAPAVAAAPALSSIGYASTTTKAPTAKPIVIKDVVVEKKREEAAQKAREAAEARRAAAERASRSATRATLTSSTYSPKATVNGSSGQKSAYNWATAGQCTWGALNKWYQSEGYYPGGWTGNAMAWGYGAANAGYTVSSTPRTRSIVVMQPGVHGSSSVGHVAWVTAVNGNEITMIEMNALAGPYNYNTRTVTHVGGMQYIYAP
ncbi:CHAP domain-containing protein [Intrasporangium sp. DVR]|uniref:CHAP domain-containing protein n=1 Tax=Intrasporangium sp. DVR TaxID=3127867 RepID=UPI00313A67C8